MYLLVRFSEVFWPCRNTNGYLRGRALRMMGWVGLCKLAQLSTPPLFDPRCCFEVAEVGGSKGWVITEQTDVCWRPTWITQTDLRPPDQKKKKLQQKPVYRPRLTTQLVLRQNLKWCHHKIIQACCS